MEKEEKQELEQEKEHEQEHELNQGQDDCVKRNVRRFRR